MHVVLHFATSILHYKHFWYCIKRTAMNYPGKEAICVFIVTVLVNYHINISISFVSW
jgi:hypothetical protein